MRFPLLAEELFYRPVEGLLVSVPLLVLLVEGLRRAVGLPFTIVALIFMIYGLVGHLVPGELAGRYVRPADLATYLALDTNALFGIPLIIGSTIVAAFVLFGNLLAQSGGSRFFTDLSIALMGRRRGGSAKIAVVASSLFGTISGSAVSNVASTGVMTIPLMHQAHYSARAAAAIEAVASTGGQLMPPIMGAAAFLMAELLQIPYRDIVLAALIPALLYYVALFIQVDLEAARLDIPGVDRDEIPSLRKTLAGGWHYPLPFAVLIVALFEYNLPPQLAALYASLALTAGGLLFGYRGRRMTLGAALSTIRTTGFAVLDIIAIVGAAGIVIGVLNVTGLGGAVALLLVHLGAGSTVLLLVLAALISIILGMGMPTVGVYVLLAALVAPALVEVGIPPIAAHMFVLYFGMMSMITPPIALAAFTAASLAGSEPMRTGLTAMRFGWSAYIVPFIFAVSPALLMIGSPYTIAVTTVTAVAGVWFASAGIAGYFAGPLGPAGRIAFIICGIALLAPTTLTGWMAYTYLGGGILAFALVAYRLTRRRTVTASS